MTNLKLWEELFDKTLREYKIIYHDKISIFISVINHHSVIVIELGTNGLELQSRKTTDPADKIATKNIIIKNKTVSQITPLNKLKIEELFKKFVGGAREH